MSSFNIPPAAEHFFRKTFFQNRNPHDGTPDNVGAENNKDVNVRQTAESGGQLNPAVQVRLDALIGSPPTFHKNAILKDYGTGLSRTTLNRAQRKAMLEAFFNYKGTILPPLTKAEKEECYRQLANKLPELTALIDSVYKPE